MSHYTWLKHVFDWHDIFHSPSRLSILHLKCLGQEMFWNSDPAPHPHPGQILEYLHTSNETSWGLESNVIIKVPVLHCFCT